MKCTGVNCPLQSKELDPKTCMVADICNWATKVASTNADRIRAMTDEELAEYIRVFFPEICPPGKCPGEDYCYKCWLDWLKQEADDGE